MKLSLLFIIFLSACAGSSFRAPSSSQPASPHSKISAEVMQEDFRQFLKNLPPEATELINSYMYENSPIKVGLKEGQWEESWLRPVEINMEASLFRGNVYINSFFRKKVFSITGSEVIGDPKEVGAAQPYFSVGSDSHLTWRSEGGTPQLLRTLVEGNPNGIRLYRGTNRMSAVIYTYLKDLLQRNGENGPWTDEDAKAFQGVLAKIAADPVNKGQMEFMPRWKKFAATQAKKRPTALEFAIGALNVFSPDMEGTFTTTDPWGASTFAFKNVLEKDQPLPFGAILVFDVDPRKLTPDVLSSIYAGVESESATYVEIAFMGTNARKLLIESLVDARFKPEPRPSKPKTYGE
jgi:hypothetical protein